MAASSGLRIEKLRRDHAVDGFDCGNETLDTFLKRHALQNQQSNASQTYVGLNGDAVVGYYTLVFGSVAHAEAPERLRKGLGQYPIPIMLLARLAVDAEWQGSGLGSGLLKDALSRSLVAAEIAGVRAFAVHAKHDEAAAFYRRFNFVASDIDPLHMFVLLKDVRALLVPRG